MSLIDVIISVLIFFLPWVFLLIALYIPDRDENDDDTGSKNDNDSNT